MFKSSEIILNPDGSVYHLHLLPEHLADTIITVGDPGRVKFVSKHFSHLEHIVEKREFITHTGYFKNKRITVISTGIGTDNIDIVMNEIHILKHVNLHTRTLIPEVNPFQIFRIGTSGSIQPDIIVDSFVASHYAVGLDNLMHFYNYQNSQDEYDLLQNLLRADILPNTLSLYAFSSSKILQPYFDKGFYKGITITSPGFYGPQGRNIFSPPVIHGFIHALGNFEFKGYRICNFEMESSALYGLSSMLGHQCISLNAILANRVDGTYSLHPEKTIEKLIETSLEIIATIP